jgi:MFS family permease
LPFDGREKDVVSEATQAPGATRVTETPTFKPGDLVTYRGYQQAALSWLQYGTAIGAVYFVVGPLIAGMLPDVKWSIGVVSDALLVRGLLGMGTAPLTGWLVARYGVRPVVMVGGLLTAGFTALTGTVSNPWEFGAIFGVALSAADAFMGQIPSVTIVHNWFMDRRGVVMGFVNSGAGFGGLVFSPLMALLIRDFGWRHGLYVLALIILVLALPSVFLRNKPRDVGQWVDGVEGREIPPHNQVDVLGTVQTTLGRMVRSPLYWAVFFIFGVEAWALGTFASFQVLFLQAQGVGSLASSGALGFAAGVAAVAGILFSRLTDKISPYYVLIGSTTLLLIGSILFISAKNPAILWSYSFVFGAGYGILVPTVPVALSRYFGAVEFSKMFGIGQILVGLMGGLGPWVTGQISDHTGSYTIPIYLVTGLLAASVLIAIAARPHGLRAGRVGRAGQALAAAPTAAPLDAPVVFPDDYAPEQN